MKNESIINSDLKTYFLLLMSTHNLVSHILNNLTLNYFCILKYHYEDEQGETELAQVTIAALGHELEHFEALSPTCTKDGNVEYWRCSVCGEAFEDGEGATALEDVSIPALGHTWEHHEALPATCTEDGVVEYWHCTVCTATQTNFLVIFYRIIQQIIQ